MWDLYENWQINKRINVGQCRDHESWLLDAVLWRHHKSKMAVKADNRHLGNSNIAIFPWNVIRLRSNFLCLCQYGQTKKVCFKLNSIPRSLNAVTRSIETVGVERRGKLDGLGRPRNIFVFDVFICILLLAVYKRRETKRDDILLTVQDEELSIY